MEYYTDVTDMSADSNQPFEGINELYGFHHALAYYAAHKAAVVDGRFKAAETFYGMFELLAKKMEENCRARPSYLPSAVGSQ